MQRQRSFTPFQDHIAADKARLKAKVVCLRDSPEKDELLERIRQLEIASLALAVISTAKGLENSSTLIHHPPERWVLPVLHLDPCFGLSSTCGRLLDLNQYGHFGIAAGIGRIHQHPRSLWP